MKNSGKFFSLIRRTDTFGLGTGKDRGNVLKQACELQEVHAVVVNNSGYGTELEEQLDAFDFAVLRSNNFKDECPKKLDQFITVNNLA